MSELRVNPVDDLLRECFDTKGDLKTELIKCALASAYRQGFDACRSRLPNITMDHCPVRPPVWPVDEIRVRERAAQLASQILGKKHV